MNGVSHGGLTYILMEQWLGGGYKLMDIPPGKLAYKLRDQRIFRNTVFVGNPVSLSFQKIVNIKINVQQV